ncbi:MAG: V-type ATP synthase subunit C, partial [Deltaproteobacteria bacterium]
LFTAGFAGEPKRFFLEGGGYVSLSLFRRLMEGEVAALEELGNTAFHRVSEVRDLSALDRGLHCILLAKGREGAKDVLGAGLAVDYIQRKHWEGGRIRLLARRAYYNLPSSSVKQELFC